MSLVMWIAQTDPTFGPWAQLSGAAIAVSALAYIARLLARGDLVHRRQANVEETLRDIAADLVRLADAAHHREEQLEEVIRHLVLDRSPHDTTARD